MTVPYSYAPPPLSEKDFCGGVVNAPQVPFTRSAREELHRAGGVPGRAGPGAYDVRIDALSTKHRTVIDGTFPTASREGVATRRATAAGPGEYDSLRALDVVKPSSARIPFPRASRDVQSATASNPGPRVVKFVQRGTCAQSFGRGPGHIATSSAPVTAVAGIHNGTRLARGTPAQSFSRARRET